MFLPLSFLNSHSSCAGQQQQCSNLNPIHYLASRSHYTLRPLKLFLKGVFQDCTTRRRRCNRAPKYWRINCFQLFIVLLNLALGIYCCTRSTVAFFVPVLWETLFAMPDYPC